MTDSHVAPAQRHKLLLAATVFLEQFVEYGEPTVQVYVMSSDRPSYLSTALSSVLASSRGLAEVIVSDNSKFDDVERLVAEKFPSVRYVRRKEYLSMVEHYRILLKEASSDYIVLFHDDDVMLPDYIWKMRDALIADPNIAAVGCNAHVLRGELLQHRLFMARRAAMLVQDVQTLLEPYLSVGGEGYPPFPSYMYRRAKLKGTLFSAHEAGKHADVTFLCSIVRGASIRWIPEPLMNYRFHTSNISRHESIGDRLRWFRHMVAREGLNRKSNLLRDYRFKYWCRFWIDRYTRGELRLPRARWEWIVVRFILQTGFVITVTEPWVWLSVLKRRS